MVAAGNLRLGARVKEEPLSKASTMTRSYHNSLRLQVDSRKHSAVASSAWLHRPKQCSVLYMLWDWTMMPGTTARSAIPPQAGQYRMLNAREDAEGMI